MAKRFGVPEDKIAAISQYQLHPDFTDRERAALRLAEAMTQSGGAVDDSVWNEAARHFDEGEMIELVAVIGAFNCFNRMANCLRVEVTR